MLSIYLKSVSAVCWNCWFKLTNSLDTFTDQEQWGKISEYATLLLACQRNSFMMNMISFSTYLATCFALSPWTVRVLTPSPKLFLAWQLLQSDSQSKGSIPLANMDNVIFFTVLIVQLIRKSDLWKDIHHKKEECAHVYSWLVVWWKHSFQIHLLT